MINKNNNFWKNNNLFHYPSSSDRVIQNIWNKYEDSTKVRPWEDTVKLKSNSKTRSNSSKKVEEL